MERPVNVWERQWILGAVAVSIAVRTEQFLSSSLAALSVSNRSFPISAEIILGKASLLGNGFEGAVARAVSGNDERAHVHAHFL